jgi:hypothetical protein
LDRRTLIEQAKGMLMAKEDIDAAARSSASALPLVRVGGGLSTWPTT